MTTFIDIPSSLCRETGHTVSQSRGRAVYFTVKVCYHCPPQPGLRTLEAYRNDQYLQQPARRRDPLRRLMARRAPAGVGGPVRSAGRQPALWRNGATNAGHQPRRPRQAHAWRPAPPDSSPGRRRSTGIPSSRHRRSASSSTGRISAPAVEIQRRRPLPRRRDVSMARRSRHGGQPGERRAVHAFGIRRAVRPSSSIRGCRTIPPRSASSSMAAAEECRMRRPPS